MTESDSVLNSLWLDISTLHYLECLKLIGFWMYHIVLLLILQRSWRIEHNFCFFYFLFCCWLLSYLRCYQVQHILKSICSFMSVIHQSAVIRCVDTYCFMHDPLIRCFLSASLLCFDPLFYHADPLFCVRDPLLRSASSTSVNFIVGGGGTGVPMVRYPHLIFRPCNFFALGSPIAMFLTVRGVDALGDDFHLPTCPGFFNIFHPVWIKLRI